MNKSRSYRGLLWTARIYSSVIILIVLYIIVQEYMEELKSHSASPLASMVNGMTGLWIIGGITFLGLMIAFWKEGIGGAISLVSTITFFLVLESGDLHVFSGTAMLIVAIPSVLYLIYWGIGLRKA
jgi:hypothetical protein